MRYAFIRTQEDAARVTRLCAALAGYIFLKQLNFHVSLVRLVGC